MPVSKKTGKSKNCTPTVETTSDETAAPNSDVVTIDRRARNRRIKDPNEADIRAIVAEEKKKAKVQRRRQIDPTTCERDYTGDEVEFMKAFEQYKRANGRMFPTCSEVLEVIRGLGYVKLPVEQTVETTLASIDAALEQSK